MRIDAGAVRRRPNHRLRLAFAIALAFGACVGGDPASNAPSAFTVPTEAVNVLATPDVVSRVVDLQPAADGRVWVLNAVPPFFVVLGPDGQTERQFGLQGGGPDEFGTPWALTTGAAPGDIWALDVRRSALIRISEAERRELTIPRDSMPMPSLVSFKGAGINAAPPWIEGTSDGLLIARARVTRQESALHLWDADILRLRAAGTDTSVELYAPLADLLGDPTSRFGDATVLLPYPLWTVCGDGTVALYDPLTNSVGRVTREGSELGTASLPDERRVTMTADVVFEMFYRQFAEDRPSSQVPDIEEMRRLTAEQNEEFVARSSESFPEYSELRCTPNGDLWLRLFDATDGRLGLGSDWIRLSPDGARTSVALPSAFRTFRIDDDRIWGTLRDDLDVESVAWIDVGALR